MRAAMCRKLKWLISEIIHNIRNYLYNYYIFKSITCLCVGFFIYYIFFLQFLWGVGWGGFGLFIYLF